MSIRSKNISIDQDLAWAVDYHLASQHPNEQPDNAPRNFSDAVEIGLRLFLKREGTSVDQLIESAKRAIK